MKQRCFARVEILRHALVEHTPAEADDLPRRIDDREHHPSEQLLVKLLRLALADQTETERVFDRDLFLAQQIGKSRTAVRRVAQHELARRRFIDAARFQICQCLGAVGMAE